MPSWKNLELGPCVIYLEEDGQDVDTGYLGTVTVEPSSSASPLTASRKGTSAIDKILTGGDFNIKIEFKEMSLANYARAYPHAVLTQDGGRVDFVNRVGLSLRSLAKKLTLKKLVGEVESTDPRDWLIVPEASPVEGNLSVVYDASTQRVLAATFQAWPDDTTNRWGYMGDETAS